MKPQAIAGVSAGAEREIETVYPSIAAGGIGRLIGSLCDSVPIRIGGVKLSALLFGLPTAPLALALYAFSKLFGRRYVLTNRSLKLLSSVGETLFRQVALAEIDNIAVDVLGGQRFYHAGNLILLKSNGDEITTLEGVNRPERFRQIILDARDARLQSDASLAVLEARQPQPA